MFQCEECNMWRLIYSKHKLSVAYSMVLKVTESWAEPGNEARIAPNALSCNRY